MLKCNQFKYLDSIIQKNKAIQVFLYNTYIVYYYYFSSKVYINNICSAKADIRNLKKEEEERERERERLCIISIVKKK